jgi:hypothetical protein
MKIISALLFLFIITPLLSVGQSYTVVHVTGKIIVPSSQKKLSVGDALSAKDVLSFPEQEAWAILINSTGEQSFLQSSAKGDTTQFVKQALQVIEKTQHPVTRKNNEPVSDLKSYFSGPPFVFIGNDFYVEVDSNVYPLDDRLFLLYRFNFEARIITHKLPHEKQVIHFNKPFLYEYKATHFPYTKTTQTELSYFNATNNIPTFIAAIRPIWLNEEELKKELLIIQKAYSAQKNSREELKKVFLQYVQDVYGKTDEINFMNWVERTVL